VDAVLLLTGEDQVELPVAVEVEEARNGGTALVCKQPRGRERERERLPGLLSIRPLEDRALLRVLEQQFAPAVAVEVPHHDRTITAKGFRDAGLFEPGGVETCQRRRLLPRTSVVLP